MKPQFMVFGIGIGLVAVASFVLRGRDAESFDEAIERSTNPESAEGSETIDSGVGASSETAQITGALFSDPSFDRESLSDPPMSGMPAVAILAGRLIDDATGKPIGDALVCVTDPETKTTRTARVDAHGEFVVRPFAVGHPLEASAEVGGKTMRAPHIDALEPGLNDREVRVSELILLRGRVIDLDRGTPVTSSVRAHWGGDLFVEFDDDGRFTVRDVPRAMKSRSPDTPMEITTNAARGFGTIATIPASRVGEDREWTFFLGRGCRISGTIRTASGDPAPRAEVELIASDHGKLVSWEPDGISRRPETNTRKSFASSASKNGAFTLWSVLPRVPYELILRVDGVTTRRTISPIPIDGTRVSLDVELPDHSGELSIETREKGRRAVAELSWEGVDVQGSATTNDDGTSRIKGLPPVELRVAAEFLDSGRIVEREVEIRQGQATSLVLESRDLRAIRGRVVDSTGNAIAGVSVGARVLPPFDLASYIDEDGESISDITSLAELSTNLSRAILTSFAISDARGEFVFRDLDENDRYHVVLADDRFEFVPRILAVGSDGFDVTAKPIVGQDGDAR